MKRKIRCSCLLLLLLVISTFLSSCSLLEKEKEDIFEPVMSALYVRENGSVVSVEIQSFSESYYDVEELLFLIEEEVIAYNTSQGAPALAYEPSEEESVLYVSIDSLVQSDGQVILRMSYRDTQTYLDFNREYAAPVTALVNRTVEEAVSAGESFVDSYRSVAGKTATASDFQKKKSWYVLTVTASEDNTAAYPVQIQGSIQYVSVNAEEVTETSVTIAPGDTVTIIYK